MTIEELKKDRYWLTGYTETERVIALIDAEIERQSVGDGVRGGGVTMTDHITISKMETTTEKGRIE